MIYYHYHWLHAVPRVTLDTNEEFEMIFDPCSGFVTDVLLRIIAQLVVR